MVAEYGLSTLLLEKKTFPRHKTCAGWVNALTFEKFPYLKEEMSALVEAPFYAIRFYDGNLERSATYEESQPCGYVTLRPKLDHRLAELAERSGATLRQGVRVRAVEDDRNEVTVKLEDGSKLSSRFVIGADGANSGVARWTGLRRGWRSNQYVLCANEDIPYDSSKLRSFYGPRNSIIVTLRFHGLDGYGWIFPKREHICVGIGGRVSAGKDIRALLQLLCETARKRNILPRDAALKRPDYALDPAGAVHTLPSLTRGRIVLIGDAAGLVSGRTGEGIFPGMVSSALAADVIRRCLKHGSSDLSDFNHRWRDSLGEYLRPLTRGARKRSAVSHLDWIFNSRLAAAFAGRVFLYGEPVGWRTLLRAIF